MDPLLLLVVLLWSSGVQAEEKHDSTEFARLVRGASRCAGTLEIKHLGEWRPIDMSDWTLKTSAIFCEHLDCGSAVSVEERKESAGRSVWMINSDCAQSGAALGECVISGSSSSIVDFTCSDSVRLLNGSSLCSGRLEVKSNQSWSSVCEADFDQQDAEVVCRELGCGPPLVLQGALYGEVDAPVWSKEYQCGGHESALLDCRSSGSARNSCSAGKAVGLTCSEPFRLVGGANHCKGIVEVKQGGWRSVGSSDWSLKEAAAVCQHLDCGSAVSVGQRKVVSLRSMWRITPDCVHSGSAVRECARLNLFFYIQHLTCQNSVRLLNGSSLCSGRLEVKSNQSWSSVCEADFDQQDAEVVCRELGCGPPSVLQGALYGEVEAPVWSKEFQCGGHESALLDCRSSGSARNSCSPGKAVGLTCSEPDRIRLVGGDSHCEGILELKYLGDWKPVFIRHWNLKAAAVVCEHLGCGSAVSAQSEDSTEKNVWLIRPDCVKPGSALWECAKSGYSSNVLKVTCSGLQAEEKHNATEPDDVRLMGGANLCADSVRLLNGSSLCSGRLEVKSDQSWSSVCEADFDQQDAEVVCRELGCGPPSVLQGALYGEVEASVWSKEFQCGGHESALLDCRSSGSARNSCSPGKAVGLTCSESVRLMGGVSPCAGILEVKLGDWKPVFVPNWSLKEAAVICEHLGCGSAVSLRMITKSLARLPTRIKPECVQSFCAVRECVTSVYSLNILDFTCSGQQEAELEQTGKH
ncbi:scavenger receptor cysteine-rich type 1 protein M130-like isoform X2 [Astatotilapia calliptera]|uniref:scavenger receptor cysteine-rich type 1 protein M130-like isoform X2 n=1 Tax=Astatotilapia calliptera TaxID=8154 RepID=UPI000E416CBE|nr:scavenger receptor cysteine-rich type 1 protein M130-like isoform X2 [Astatotilapia calliptera]